MPKSIDSKESTGYPSSHPIRDGIVRAVAAGAAGGLVLLPVACAPNATPNASSGTCATAEALRNPELPPRSLLPNDRVSSPPINGSTMSLIGARLLQEPSFNPKPLSEVLGPQAAAATVDGTTLEEAAAITGVSNASVQGRTYNTLWAQLNDRYAVFEQRLPEGKTWEQLGRDFGRGINANMSDHELYDQLRDLFQQLNDGHSSISAEHLNREDSSQTDHYHQDEIEIARGNILNEYLDDGGMKILTHGNIAYGRIPDPDGKGDIGYISITGMSGMTNADEEPEDQAATREAMRTIMCELGDVSAMIVDVRSNGGGWDEVAKEVASFFEGPESHAWTKWSRNGLGWSEPLVENVAASPPDAYAGPVAVLTGPGSFSAGELFALAMRNRPNAVIVGEPTTGHYSDVYGASAEFPTGDPNDGVLPNGIEFSFSGELYIGFDGTIEGQSPKIDHRVDFDPEAFEKGVDNQLEAAMKILRGE